MNAMDLLEKAKEKVHKKALDGMTEELERLIEKEAKAQLVLDNIRREKEDKIAYINDKLNALMSCKLSGVSGDSPGSSE
jgi:hypothetical protein